MPNPFTVTNPARRVLDRAPKGLAAFIAVGVAGLATHTALFTLLYHLHLDKPVAWFAGLATATCVTWVLNRKLTFAASGRSASSEALRYIIVTGVAQGVSFGVFTATGHFLPGFPAPLAVVLGSGVATLFSYTGQRFFTFAAPKIAAEVMTAELAYPGAAAVVMHSSDADLQQSDAKL